MAAEIVVPELSKIHISVSVFKASVPAHLVFKPVALVPLTILAAKGEFTFAMLEAVFPFTCVYTSTVCIDYSPLSMILVLLIHLSPVLIKLVAV